MGQTGRARRCAGRRCRGLLHLCEGVGWRGSGAAAEGVVEEKAVISWVARCRAEVLKVHRTGRMGSVTRDGNWPSWSAVYRKSMVFLDEVS
jgi:hypothetical protein